MKIFMILFTIIFLNLHLNAYDKEDLKILKKQKDCIACDLSFGSC